MKKLLIAFILFLLLLLLIVQLPRTGKLIQASEDTDNLNDYLAKANDTKWRFIGRVQIENGRIVSVNITSTK
jgi:outer membrane lipoprotein-sorting protein